jgi:hypothetical protein
VLVSLSLAMLGGCAECAAAQAPLAVTTVQDTVYTASGSPASGTVVVSWPGFTTASGAVVPAGTTSAVIGANGLLSVTLAPNAGATPIGSYYTATFHLSDGTTSREYWVVPATVAGGGPVKLAGIQNQVLPTSVAMQTVSKAYVDTAIAAAMTGHPADASSVYVLKAGDTMTGPLVLPGDPVSANQAADKNYVDENVAARSQVFGASGSAHAAGAVPDPGATAGATRYLREDGSWNVPSVGAASGWSVTPTAQASSAVCDTADGYVCTSMSGVVLVATNASFPGYNPIFTMTLGQTKASGKWVCLYTAVAPANSSTYFPAGQAGGDSSSTVSVAQIASAQNGVSGAQTFQVFYQCN